MDYLEILKHSYDVEKLQLECPPEGRLEYLSGSIFGFKTYDSAMAALFAGKAVEVCAAINCGETYNYCHDKENYKWYLLMCNMPFFAERLEWGTSIHGAWWCPPQGEPYITLQSSGLYVRHRQWPEPWKFTIGAWRAFITAIIQFAAEECQ